MFDSFGGVSSFLLGIIMLQDVYDGHEVNLLPGSTCSSKPTHSRSNNYRNSPAGGALSTAFIIQLLNTPLVVTV